MLLELLDDALHDGRAGDEEIANVHDDDAHFPFCDACLEDVDRWPGLVFLEPELRQDGVQLGMPEISCTGMSVECSKKLGHRVEFQPPNRPPCPRELDERGAPILQIRIYTRS